MSYMKETSAAKIAVMGTTTQYTQDIRFSTFNDSYMYADANKSIKMRITGVSKIKFLNTTQNNQPGSSEYLLDITPLGAAISNTIDYASRASMWRTSNTKFGGRTDARVPEAVFSKKGCTMTSLTGSSQTNNVALVGSYCCVSMLPIGDNR